MTGKLGQNRMVKSLHFELKDKKNHYPKGPRNTKLKDNEC